MKRVLCIVFVIVFALVMVLCTACQGETRVQAADASTLAELYVKGNTDEPTMSDYTLAADFDASTIRFAFYSPSTGWVEDVEQAPFDETRPTVIYSHGQGGDGYMATPVAMYNEGYNVVSFLWGCMSDDALTPIEQKIWQRIEQYTIYENGKTKYVKSQEFDCTVPELFVARYCDFFRLHPDYDRPIRLVGHSYGGQLTFALATYITTLFQNNRLSARLLPERYTLLDPYFDNQIIDFECQWLGRTLNYSSVGAAIYAYENILSPNNVAIEMLRTSPLVEMATVMGVGDDNAPDYFTQLKPLFRVVELKNINELRDQFEDKIMAMGFWHTIANDFYWSPNANSNYYDEDGVLIFGRENPAELVLATRGMHFDWWVDEEDYSRYGNVTVARTINEENENTTVVAGLVMADANGNAQADEKAAYRLDGVTVMLCDVTNGTQETCSTRGGYFCFEAERGHQYVLDVYAGNYMRESVTIEASQFVNLANFALRAR